jgi:hypothetical protein
MKLIEYILDSIIDKRNQNNNNKNTIYDNYNNNNNMRMTTFHYDL